MISSYRSKAEGNEGWNSSHRPQPIIEGIQSSNPSRTGLDAETMEEYYLLADFQAHQPRDSTEHSPLSSVAIKKMPTRDQSDGANSSPAVPTLKISHRHSDLRQAV